MNSDELNAFAAQVTAAALTLPHAARGRQNDAGAVLVSAGILITPMYTDPALPGKVFSADLVELKQGRLGVHQVLTIRDGEIGNNANVRPMPQSIGNPSAILSLLGGHLLPGVLGNVLAGGDPLSLLTSLLRDRK